MNTKTITTIVGNVKKTIGANSSTILMGGGIGFFMSAVIMAADGGIKAEKIISEEYARRERQPFGTEIITLREKAELTWKCYIPAATLAGLGVLCTSMGYMKEVRRSALLLGLVSSSETALKEYQAKVKEQFGSEAHKKIKRELGEEKRNMKRPSSDREIYVTGRGDTLCFDEFGGRYFTSDMEFIEAVITSLNRDMMSEMFITLNDVYYAIGLRSCKVGDMLGWRVEDGFIKPRFTSSLTDEGVPTLVLGFEEDPKVMFD